jgi:hypothetical protein
MTGSPVFILKNVKDIDIKNVKGTKDIYISSTEKKVF